MRVIGEAFTGGSGLWQCEWIGIDGLANEPFFASEIAIRKRFRKVS